MPLRPPRHRPAPKPREQRQSAYARGYDGSWRAFRAAHAMTVPPICVDCGYAGSSPEMELDHIIPLDQGGAKFDPDNLAWRCGQRASSGNACHAKKTRREQHAPLGRVHVVCGQPGSGKTTLVRERSTPGALVWDYDVVLAGMTSLPLYDRPADLIDPLLAMLDGLVNHLAIHPPRRDVWLIITDPHRANEIATRTRAELIHVRTSEEECHRRLAARSTQR